MKIKNMEGLTIKDIKREIDNGGKFVLFQYTVSFLIVTLKRPTAIYFISANEKSSAKGLPYTLLSAVLGWWGIPWGPIYTFQSIVSNIKGGKDVTQQVLASLVANATTRNVSEALAG